MRAGFRVGILVLLSLGCLGREATPPPSLTTVILLMEGVAGDRGPFDFAAAGVAVFQREEGVRVPLWAMGGDPIAWERMVRDAAREPAYRLFLIGMEGPARLGLEQALVFPGKRFVLLGLEDLSAVPPNVLAISFSDWEAGWIAGYIAGRWVRREGPPEVKGQRIGALVGPGAAIALAGYRCGAQAAGLGPEEILVEEIGSDRDPVAGFEAALRLYAQGVEVALGLAGGSSAGLFEAAAAVRRYAIGFGVDWYARYAAMKAPAADALLGSVTPAIDEAVRRVLRQSRRGGLPFGVRWTMGWEEGGITWRGSPTFFRWAPSELRRDLRGRIVRPAPCR